MQRKALKQFNKVTQWTNEKVFSGERTIYSDEFEEFESEVEPIRRGIERLHATSVPFFEQVAKVKPSADPYPSSGPNKDKINVGEALGLVMIDTGNEAGGPYGDGLVKYGRVRCKIASVNEDWSERLRDFTVSTETALAAVNEYKVFRKKMDSRRLTLDSALSRQKQLKKDNPTLEQEVELAHQRFEEAEDETKLRMINIKEQEVEQFEALRVLIDAEYEYFSRCKDLIENLRHTFPSPESKIQTRPRARSNVSIKSGGARTPTRGTLGRSTDSDSDEPVARPGSATQTSSTRPRLDASNHNSGGGGRNRSDSNPTRPRADSGAATRARSDSVTNRSRSDSNASAGKGGGGKGRSLFSKMGFGGKKDGVNLASDDEGPKPYDMANPYDPPAKSTRPVNNRARSHSVVSVVTGPGLAPPDMDTTPRRRALTSPSSPAGNFVKALYDFEGLESDELPLRRGQIVEIKKQVSDDWLLGECEGMSGIFPKAYTEEYTTVAATIVGRRLPLRSRDHSMTDDDTDAESISQAEHDDDNTHLAVAAQPTPTSGNRARAGSVKKPAPPPPPSRRSNSNSNIASLAKSPPPILRSRSNTVSRTTTLSSSDEREERPSLDDQMTSPFDDGPGHSLAHGAGSLGLRSNSGDSHHDACGKCGCSDFTQNVFKTAGTCSTCFHQH